MAERGPVRIVALPGMRRLRWLWVAVAALMAMAVAATVLWHQNRALTAKLTAVHRQLTVEADRLHLDNRQLNGTLTDLALQAALTPAAPPDAAEPPTAGTEMAPTVAVSDAESTTPASAKPPARPQGVDAGVVAVQDFRMQRVPGAAALSIEFKLVNARSDHRPVSGRAFVMLKPVHDSNDRWMVLPAATMTDGPQPTDLQLGDPFAITRFKTVRLQGRLVAAQHGFDQAAVLVYESDGRLLLKKNIAIHPDPQPAADLPAVGDRAPFDPPHDGSLS